MNLQRTGEFSMIKLFWKIHWKVTYFLWLVRRVYFVKLYRKIFKNRDYYKTKITQETFIYHLDKPPINIKKRKNY
jgi:hypothetical protein